MALKAAPRSRRSLQRVRAGRAARAPHRSALAMRVASAMSPLSRSIWLL